MRLNLGMPKFVPTPEQAAILCHPPGDHGRILAGPGTGKSATVVSLVEQLLQGKEPPAVKLLTFTRAATAELAEKVSESPTAHADRPSTVHSFAISVLLRNPNSGGFPEPLRMADDWEDKNLILPTLAGRSGFTTKKLRALRREMASAWESLTPADDPSVPPEDRARFVAAWNEHRRIFGYTLLAELPYALRRALMNHPDLEGIAYDSLIVDEYQDLNACDLDLLRLLSLRGCALIGVGDDDQSIYSFRKAAPEGIRRFLTDYPGSRDYSLSVSHRCGKKILDWANYVISGDLDRLDDKRPTTPHPASPPGETALLSFKGHAAEPKGIARLVHQLIKRNGLAPSEILILLRTDHNGGFSKPIKKELDELQIPWNDPDAVKPLLAEEQNRRLLALLRLIVDAEDSLAWASLLKLASGVGNKFVEYVYAHALSRTTRFADALIDLYDQGFPDGPSPSRGKALSAVKETLAWLQRHESPEATPAEGWGTWISDLASSDSLSTPTADFNSVLTEIDAIVDDDIELGRYLGQIQPLGEDLATAKSNGVRLMSMMSSKGLTVRAAILAAVEDGVVPRPAPANLAEECRILYVAMTRAKEHLFVTWARQRRGPTARAGKPSSNLRQHSHFLDDGPVQSQDGDDFLANR